MSYVSRAGKMNARVATLAIAFSCLAIPAQGSAMVAPGSGSDEVALEGLESWVADDIRAYAESSGLSLSEAREYVRGQEEFGEVVDKFEDENPEVFIAAEWDGPTSARTRVLVNDQRPHMSLNRLGIRFEYSDAPTREQRDQIEADVVSRISAVVGKWEGSVSYDPFENKLEAIVGRPQGGSYLGAPLEPVDVPAIQADIEAYLNQRAVTNQTSESQSVPAFATPNVTVRTQLPEERVELEYGSGGNLRGCTAGFTITRRGGRSPGIMTARHCPDVSWYDGSRLRERKETPDAGGDIESYLGSGDITNRLRYDWGKFRNIEKRRNPSKGNVVCKFGITTGHGCAEVIAISRTIKTNSGNFGKQIVTDKKITAPGDSGGPWFWSTTAMGIHSSSSDCHSNFTRVRAGEDIDSYVYTGK